MSTTTVSAPSSGVNVTRGLLWRDWLVQRRFVVSCIVVWVLGGCVLLLFFHPGFIIALGSLYALMAGTRLGGGEAAEGSEEFAFALPPTRSERYVARLALGIGTVLTLSTAGVLAIAFDLPQHVWALVVESGFTEPFPACEEQFLYPLAVAIPLMAFAATFAFAAIAESREAVYGAWFVGGVVTGALLGLCFIGEYLLWEVLNGYVSVPVLLALTPVVLWAGHVVYVRKEGVSRPAPMEARGGRGVWVVLGILVLFLLLMMWHLTGVRSTSLEMRERDAQRAAMDEVATEEAATMPAPPPEPEPSPQEKKEAP
jgi:hypothetical protein